MRHQQHEFFRWTPRTARVVIVSMAIIPITLGYFMFKTQVYTFTFIIIIVVIIIIVIIVIVIVIV